MAPRRSGEYAEEKQRDESCCLPASLPLSNNKECEQTRVEEPPLDQIISFLALVDPRESPRATKRGVRVPLLLQELFGIEYLPRLDDDGGHNSEIGASADASTPSSAAARLLLEDDDAGSIPSDLSIEEEEEDIEQVDPLLTAVKKKRTGVRKALASRVRQASARRKQRKRLESAGSESTMNTPRSASSSSPKKEPRTASRVNEAWIQKQQIKLQQHKAVLESTQQETLQVETRARNISSHIAHLQEEVVELEQALSNSIQSLQQDKQLLQRNKKDLKRLESKRNKAARAVQETSTAILRAAGQQGKPPLRSRSSGLEDDDPMALKEAAPVAVNPRMAASDSTQSDPVLRPPAESAPVVLRRSSSSSFIRVHDLDLETTSSLASDTSSSQLRDAKNMFFLDDDVSTVVQALARFGYDLATDESSRFVPALNTEKLLSQPKSSMETNVDSSWPIQPWHAASGKDVLVWTGSVDHTGYGSDLPVIKARAVIPTAPRNVLDLVMDSSRASEYNKMSQGRHDILVLQAGIDTTADESDYGIAGEVKIIKSLNKPPVIRRSIELLSLIYARPLEHAGGGYLAVNRSVWENSTATPPTAKDTVRSEILLGVNIIRPVAGGPNKQEQHCELTTITQAYAPIVPDSIARKMGPTQAVTFMKDVQAIFSKR